MAHIDLEEYKKRISDQELAEMALLYDSGEKVVDIIRKYSLEINASQLSQLLPPVETNIECPYCHISMLKPRRRVTYVDKENIKCPQCGHSLSRRCDCENCIEVRKKNEVRLKKQIFERYNECIPYEKMKYAELNLEQRYCLFMLYDLENKYINLKTIESNSYRKKTALTLINKLLEMKILFVSPYSKIDAFDEIDFPKRYYPKAVDYLVNIEFTEEEERQIKRRQFCAQYEKTDEINLVLHKLIYEDILEYFEYVLQERKIGFEPTEKQLKELQILITRISYTEIRTLCLKVAKYYCDQITIGSLYKSKAPSQVLASVVSFYKNSTLHGWSIYRSNPEYAGYLLKNYIVTVMQQDISILNEVIQL